jgi:hypothetical protein
MAGRVAVVAAVLAFVAGCDGSGGSPEASSTTPPTTRSSVPVSSSTSVTIKPTTSTSGVPAQGLPSDLTPNVVEDECLLTGEELGALVGRGSVLAENTEIAGDATRRSCFYTPESTADPVARIDVYAAVSATPAELVSRVAANSPGSMSLAGIGTGAVVVQGQGGTAELVVASQTLLAVLTVLPGGAPTPPSEVAWTTAGAQIASRLPR